MNLSKNLIGQKFDITLIKPPFVLFIFFFFLLINYCCQVWDQNGNYHLYKMHSLQRSALRIINFRAFLSDVSDLFHSLKIISFINLVRVSNVLFVFDSLSNKLPIAITNLFTLSCNVHHYFTRNSKNGKLVLPLFKTRNYGKLSIKYQCITEWNKSLTSINNAFLAKYNNSFFNTFLDLNREQFIRIVRNVIYLQQK